ncbi:MAG: TadE/TadG family type IV pilus assembly protein [Acidimicrobiales bacterium]|nr:TadE/TadG family type IV pilus assembly protein [Acidimicrobiales bacterium]
MTETPFRQASAAGDRGAAMLELMLLLPFLLLLAFGGAELGVAWVTDNRVEGAVAQAARIGASSGGRVEADRDILVALRAGLPAGELARLDRVVVYLPIDAAGTVPPGCIKSAGDPTDGGLAGCNSYSGATVRGISATSMTGFGGTVGKWDAFWPPASRRDALLDPPDHIGVWVRTTHVGITGLAFDEITVVESTVFRIQPDLSG